MDPVVDARKVHEVEVILKNLIETGFADNCDEELLEFDDDGALVKVTKGITPENQRSQQVEEVFAYKDQSMTNEDQSITQSGIKLHLDDEIQSQSVSGIASPMKTVPDIQILSTFELPTDP